MSEIIVPKIIPIHSLPISYFLIESYVKSVNEKAMRVHAYIVISFRTSKNCDNLSYIGLAVEI